MENLTRRLGRKIKKNKILADTMRGIGNKHFQKKKYFEALISYNHSLCFAESTSISLAYGNRSAVYFVLELYDQCLQNIRLAFEHNFPEDKAEKLRTRWRDCFKKLKLKKGKPSSPWDFFKLSYEAHPQVPFIASVLDIREDNSSDPQFVANRNLLAGDFIAISDGALKFLDPLARLHRCTWCCRECSLDLIPCEKCPMAMYCSEECREIGKLDFHFEFCPHIPTNELDGLVLDNEDEVFVSKKIQSRLETIFSDVGHNYVTFMCDQTEKLGKIVNFFDFDWTEMDSLDKEKNLLLITLSTQKMVGNTQPTCYERLLEAVREMHMMEMVLSESINVLGEKSMLEKPESNKNYKDFTTNLIGSMMNPLLNFVSHSCAPNATFLTVDNKIVLMVLRPINSGEKILISYGPTFYNTPESKRHETFQRFFGKTCECIACVNKWQIIRGTPLKKNTSNSLENVTQRFRSKIEDINEEMKTITPEKLHWLLLDSIELDAKILSKPAFFYP